MPKRTHRNPDHVQCHNTPSLNNEAIANQLQTLLVQRDESNSAVYYNIPEQLMSAKGSKNCAWTKANPDYTQCPSAVST